jgi:superfamily II DNA or RNA helicase
MGKDAVLLVAPTGSGKTAVGCHFVKQAVDEGKRCLWLAHRSELIRQASQRLAQDYRVRHGIIKAGVADCDPRFPVQIASVQTLVRRKPIDSVGLLVVDEAHHATADTYLRIIEGHPGAIVLGLTATPWRLTGKKLGSLFDGIVAVSNYPFLIGEGYLVRPRVFLPADIPDFSSVRLLGGDFDEDQAATIMERPKLVGDVLEQWQKHAMAGKPRSTIIFACNVAHSRHIVSLFREVGISAEHLDAQVPEKEREAILDRLARGQTTVVSNVMLLSEGFDCPPVSCVVAARPTASRTLFIQMVGRALRPCVQLGKTDCIILDHAANSLRHGLIAEITTYELEEGDLLDPTKARANCKRCPHCNAVVTQNAQLCPECNYSFSLGRKLPEVEDGELVEFGGTAVPASPIEAGQNGQRGQPPPLKNGQPVQVAPQTNGHPAPPKNGHPAPRNEPPPAQRVQADSTLFAELRGPCADGYRDVLLNLKRRDALQRLTAMSGAISRLAKSEKLAFIKAGLLSEHPHLWLENVAAAKCLKNLGLGCLEKVVAARIDDYKGLTHFERTKRALETSKRDLVIRLAAMLYAAGVPNMINLATKRGFRAVRGYAPHSAQIAADTLQSLGLAGEQRECTVELIRQHEYVFDQVLHATAPDPIPKLCERWRKKLGPLWRQHFELAQALWDGAVLRWIRTNFDSVCRAFDTAEEKICAIKPEESCPLDGNTLMARYQMPTGPWLRVMKDEIGKWCLSNPTKAQDLDAIRAAADAIFEHNKQLSPVFNLDLPFLQLDDEELLKVPDPLEVLLELIEASQLKMGEVPNWARGYRRKAVVAVIGAVAHATNNKQTASMCARYFAELASLLKDITLGEVYKALTSHRRTPPEVIAAVVKGREALANLRQRYEKNRSKDMGMQLIRACRDVGHFEEAYAVAQETFRQHSEDTSLERLVDNIRRFLPPANRSPSPAQDNPLEG